ncbi:MAG: cyclic pyranopterin monophosphate synthase MoaC [Halobacteria archaeon]
MSTARRREAGSVRMVDITSKPAVARVATATGLLRLRPATLRAIRTGRVAKGNVLAVAQTAAAGAVKRTWEILPLCHPIPLTGVETELEVGRGGVRATCTVRATYKTGVEMEALVGVTAALLTVWDMVKPLEKDATGNYPGTRIERVRVVEKRKG